MIKVAVVDDDELICQEIVQLISKCNVHYDFDFCSECYTSCEEMYRLLANGENYDLIFLDIEFPGMNGIELGKLLRMIRKSFLFQQLKTMQWICFPSDQLIFS